MESTVLPILVLAVVFSFLFSALDYMAFLLPPLMATAMQLAIDAFGPIADNAGGIVERVVYQKKLEREPTI